ncbi:glycerate kinase [Paenibacillus daejeonensis]|uniref:glycerate kinase family protein n=1 Tax=Paenibacillus daejeonensis TaxID=135193 RepID=UPI00037F1AD3|nr:glycerate kinase [Paenibacillus daejeonensis]
MKVIIAIDSFKGSISSSEGGAAIAEGIKRVYPDAETVVLPLADGGEGTVEALVSGSSGQLRTASVTGPLGEPVDAIYGIMGDGETAVIEVAAACGLPLVSPERRNPTLTTTRGVGELILDAMERGCRSFVIGLGGSATNDAGIGMLQALGYRFVDDSGHEVGEGGGALARIAQIDASGTRPELTSCTFRVACDVDNPLYGPDGAAYIFAPQKGADAAMVEALDQGLRQYARAAEAHLGHDIAGIPGAGAAGGLGAALVGFLRAELLSGAELVLDSLGIEAQLADAQFVITGEGRLDGQTSRGKAPLGVARLASRHGLPVIALAGSVGSEASALNSQGVSALFPILSGPMTLEAAMDPKATAAHLQGTAEQLFRLIQATAGASS